HLLHAARPCDDRAHERILQTPCQRELRERTTEFLRDRLERSNLRQPVLVRDVILQPFIALERAAAVFWDSVLIFSGEQPGGQRAPNGGAIAILFIKAYILA